MYKKEFDNLLKSGSVCNYMLLRGVDDFQNELYAKELIKFYNNENFLQFYYDEYSFETAKSFFEPSLFGGGNTLHIKTNSAILSKEIKILIDMCKKNNTNCLIFELNEENSKISNEFLRCFDKNFVRFFKPSTPNDALNLLNKKCEIACIYSNSAALMRIYQIHNENLILSANEIEKFALLNIPLNLENVDNLVFGLSEVSFEDLFEKIFSLGDFRDEFYRYCESGSYNDTAFINYLYSAIFRLFKIHSYIKTEGKFELSAVLGYNPPPNVANSLKKYATSFSTKTFERIFRHLNECEFSIKMDTKTDKIHYLLASLLRLQHIITQNKKR